jgi:hypothetical protein
MDVGRYEDAIAEYQIALKYRPDWDIANDNIAVVKRRMDDATFPIPPDKRVEETVKALNRRDYHTAQLCAMHITNEQLRVNFLAKIQEATEKEGK